MPAIDIEPAGTPDRPAQHAALVTPSDSTDLTNVTRAIYVAVAGDVSLIMQDGAQFTWPGMAVGYHPVRASRIRSTGTTATGIVALW